MEPLAQNATLPISEMLKASIGADSSTIQDASTKCLVLLGLVQVSKFSMAILCVRFVQRCTIQNTKYHRASFLYLIESAAKILHTIFTEEAATSPPKTWWNSARQDIVKDFVWYLLSLSDMTRGISATPYYSTLAKMEQLIHDSDKRSRAMKIIRNTDDQRKIEGIKTDFYRVSMKLRVIRLSQHVAEFIQL